MNLAPSKLLFFTVKPDISFPISQIADKIVIISKNSLTFNDNLIMNM